MVDNGLYDDFERELDKPGLYLLASKLDDDLTNELNVKLYTLLNNEL